MKHYLISFVILSAAQTTYAQLFSGGPITAPRALATGVTQDSHRVEFRVTTPSKVMMIANIDVNPSGCTQTNTALSCRDKGGLVTGFLRIENTAAPGTFVHSENFQQGLGAILSASSAATYASLEIRLTAAFHTVSGVLAPGTYQAWVQLRNSSAYNLIGVRTGRITVQVVPE